MLFHNTVVTIEGLETLEKLALLNVGCNQIGDLQATYSVLRRMNSLRTVNLERNPVAKVNLYREHMVVYVPHLKILDWKRILPSFKSQAYELLRDDYRSFVTKERLEEKRRKIKSLTAERKAPKSIFSVEADNSLYKFLNQPSDEIEYLFELLDGGETALTSYKEQVSQVGQGITDRVLVLGNALTELETSLDDQINRYVNGYGTTGRRIMEALMLRKGDYLAAIIHEVEQRGKDALKGYCAVLDDVSVDLTRLLMQLQQHVEHTISSKTKKLEHQLNHDISWLTREIDILKQFEQFLQEWATTAHKDQKFETVLLPQEVKHLKELFELKHHNQSTDWLDELKSTALVQHLQERLKQKLRRLDQLQSKITGEQTARLDAIKEKFSKYEIDIFHQRMREIVDLVEQHKAEAYLLRKRMTYRLGRHEEEELHIQPAVKNLMKRRHKTTAMSIAGSGRPRKVEFENEEPLPDYVVMKDFKEIVDQIANVPVEERERLFEMRVVEMDDIADYVDIKDELDKNEFAQSMQEGISAEQGDPDFDL
ncbi:thyroid receptor-interacting protein 11-like isoform X3 [Paramacrobiotus metropolitanus]|nr:thyroid receptor-interacting protein 11-like isoform X3 [Paramacrobiotus metropolitanus]XP_055341447.1 thyroid receptor-interacting protein 11-like isoform X3 [Paramacrobiotus metropolitanus]XP_055341448.1 thyroid receptor-interacting protein 11-like isoform X3 [Paramacrobiotus metropolitanus]